MTEFKEALQQVLQCDDMEEVRITVPIAKHVKYTNNNYYKNIIDCSLDHPHTLLYDIIHYYNSYLANINLPTCFWLK